MQAKSTYNSETVTSITTSEINPLWTTQTTNTFPETTVEFMKTRAELQTRTTQQSIFAPSSSSSSTETTTTERITILTEMTTSFSEEILTTD